nr:helix-turn-helix domain-containing protein [Levilactobacillus brevis]
MKVSDYVRQFLRSNYGRFPDGAVRTFTRQILVTLEGMEALTGH